MPALSLLLTTAETVAPVVLLLLGDTTAVIPDARSAASSPVASNPQRVSVWAPAERSTEVVKETLFQSGSVAGGAAEAIPYAVGILFAETQA